MKLDLAVIGGGLAGLAAALRAAELGCRTAVFERGHAVAYPCNSRYSGGAFHVCMLDIQSPGETLMEAIDRVTDGCAQPELAGALVADAAPTYRWLKAQGVSFMQVPSINQRYVLAPARKNQPGLHWEGRGADLMLRTLETRLARLGGQVLRGSRVLSLIMSGNACRGLRIERDGRLNEIGARAVLIADGGYQGDSALLRRHVSVAPQALKQRGAATGVGDGLRMACAIGADLVGMEWGFYGHLLSLDALADDRLWPFPILDFVASAGIVVDATGRRFADEGQGGVTLANRVAAMSDPASAVAIFDDAIWNGAGRHRVIPPNPHLILAGGGVYAAASIPELAAEMALPAQELQRTVSLYNQALHEGRLTSLQPPRSVGAHRAEAIVRPPFYAARLCAGVTYTMGGLRIDADARVLRGDGEPVGGLFAAGACTGGIDGGPRSGYVGGLMKAAVFGRRAAEAVALLSGKLRGAGVAPLH